MLGQRFQKFIKDIIDRTLFLQLASALTVLWLIFSAAVFAAERGVEGSPIQSLGDALYWGIAALSTAGIANPPISGLAKLIGGVWIIIGSVMFFGIIVSTVTAYFMELDLLKENVDDLIEHMEEIKRRRK